MRKLPSRRSRLWIAAALGVPLLTVFWLGAAQGQPGRPPFPPGRPPGIPPGPGPRPGMPPGYNPPGRPPGGIGPGRMETVWDCGKCKREVARGPGSRPPATCPHCGVRLVNGSGPPTNPGPGVNPGVVNPPPFNPGPGNPPGMNPPPGGLNPPPGGVNPPPGMNPPPGGVNPPVVNPPVANPPMFNPPQNPPANNHGFHNTTTVVHQDDEGIGAPVILGIIGGVLLLGGIVVIALKQLLGF